MKRRQTPAYFSLHESTTNLLLGNFPTWKPMWDQGVASKFRNSEIVNQEVANHRITTANHNNSNNTRTHTSMYTGIMTAQHVNSIVYCAIYDSKSLSPKVGICLVDPHTSNMRIAEISDSPTFVRTIHKLNVQDDVGSLEILIPTSMSLKKTNFVKILEANLPNNASINYVPDIAFKTNDSSIEFLSKSLKDYERDVFQVELRHKKYGLAAACGCMSFLQNLPTHAFTHETFNVKFESSEDSMFISTPAISDLELVSNSKIGNTKICLFKYLNSTVTKMGERLLKNNIIQPLTNQTSLLLRYEAVNELTENKDIANEIRNEMKQLVDMDNLFSYLCKKPKNDLEIINQQKINFILLLKKVLMTTVNVKELLQSFESQLIKEILKSFENENINASLELINTYINDDCTWVNKPVELRNQKCYAVKAGNNGILDASRQLYKSLTDDILKIIDELSETHNLPMETKYDNNRGFFILIRDLNISFFSDADDTPFINFVQKGNNVETVTMDIIKLNLRIDSLLNEIFLMTEETVDELINKCRKFVSSYFFVSEAFSLLDLLCNFAIISERRGYGNYICSEIDDKNIAIKQSRNPLLEHLLVTDKTNNKCKIISNDFTVVVSTSRIQIITGPNMSGKSTYIKQFALNVILAQIGMPVPAEYSSIRIFKSLFTRISNDVTEPNMSTFSMEMSEMAFILQNADTDSLIIIDELGRGTSYKDGISLCISMIEEIQKLQCVCFFVTHFVGIPKIFKNKPGIFEMHIGISTDTNDKFKVKPGINWISGYGLSMIESLGIFPQDVVEEAKILSNKLKVSKYVATEDEEKQDRNVTQNKLILSTYEMLQHIVHNTPDSDLFATLSALENGFVENYDSLVKENVSQNELIHVPIGVATNKTDKQTSDNTLLDFDYLH
ncbi:MutS protein msh4 [Pichia californica]|uniref:MutS protein msh4 n=1 Tax=Pichia californica TaxID=460514 RepID=A0A9P6WL52_9ASCO|nr:MutS protein msh4 [[Candida] californica]